MVRTGLRSSTGGVRLAARRSDLAVLGFRLGLGLGVVAGRAAGRAIAVSAAGTAAVELDAVALARDAVALAGALTRGVAQRGHGRQRGAAGGARGQGGADGAGGAVGQLLEVVDGHGRELVAQFVDGRHGVVGLADGARRVRLLRLRVLDVGRRQGAPFGDVDRGVRAVAAALAGGRCGRGRCSVGHVEDVQVAACGGLGGEGLGRVMGDVVAVHDVLKMPLVDE